MSLLLRNLSVDHVRPWPEEVLAGAPAGIPGAARRPRLTGDTAGVLEKPPQTEMRGSCRACRLAPLPLAGYSAASLAPGNEGHQSHGSEFIFLLCSLLPFL